MKSSLSGSLPTELLFPKFPDSLSLKGAEPNQASSGEGGWGGGNEGSLPINSKLITYCFPCITLNLYFQWVNK